MNNLSIVIITKNEAKNIKKCLKSLQGISDDIIIVDSGSIDNTEEICSMFSTTFITNEFKDYSSQKNFGNNLAKNTYILSIDADECLSDTLIKSISELNLNPETNTAYTFNRLNHHCGKPIKHGGWYPDKKLRIWNKNYGSWEGTIHEKVTFPQKPIIHHLKGDLLHYTYNTKEEHISQAKKFSKLNAISDFQKGKKTNLLVAYCSCFLRFAIIYIIKLGFLDGKIGFFIAKTTADATFWRRLELLRLNKVEI